MTKIDCWYDENIKLWCAVSHDDRGIQVGVAGFGPTKQDAIEDVKYQNSL